MRQQLPSRQNVTLVQRAHGRAGPTVPYYLRFQCESGPEHGDGLNPGAELPVSRLHDLLELIAALRGLVGQAHLGVLIPSP